MAPALPQAADDRRGSRGLSFRRYLTALAAAANDEGDQAADRVAERLR